MNREDIEATMVEAGRKGWPAFDGWTRYTKSSLDREARSAATMETPGRYVRELEWAVALSDRQTTHLVVRWTDGRTHESKLAHVAI